MRIEETSGKFRSALSVSFLNDGRIILIPLMMIMAAEMLIYFDRLQAGIIFHIATSLLLMLFIMWIPESDVSRSLQVLVLLPILRLINLFMPVFSDMTLYMFIYVYLPMLLPAYLVIRNQNISLSSKLSLKWLPGYIILSLVMGAVIGLGEFLIIRPVNLVPDLSSINLLKLSVIMIFVVGFVEELIFRFLLQSRMEVSFGKFEGLLIVSLLFGFMHSGYGTLYEVLYASFAGFVLGYMFQKTRSLPFVSLTHGFVNIFLFGLIPLLPYFHV